MEALRKELNKYSAKEIKDLVRKHNLHYHIKITQPKAKLIASIIQLYSEATQHGLISKEFKLTRPGDIPEPPKKYKISKKKITKKEKDFFDSLEEMAKKQSEEIEEIKQILKRGRGRPSKYKGGEDTFTIDQLGNLDKMFLNTTKNVLQNTIGKLPGMDFLEDMAKSVIH